MDQMTLFYNVLQDAWKFCKQELTKPKSEMTDDDWEHCCDRLSEITKKYETLGESESEMCSKILLELTTYVNNQDKIRVYNKERGRYYWIRKR